MRGPLVARSPSTSGSANVAAACLDSSRGLIRAASVPDGPVGPSNTAFVWPACVSKPAFRSLGIG
eukprot:2697280-Alexandrium_andersonii.AAC.1